MPALVTLLPGLSMCRRDFFGVFGQWCIRNPVKDCYIATCSVWNSYIWFSHIFVVLQQVIVVGSLKIDQNKETRQWYDKYLYAVSVRHRALVD